MVALALKLSEAGLGDYWDDADRWGRNMLVEGQLTRGDWIDRLHLLWREHYRLNGTRWRKIERFVSKELIHW